MKMKFIFIIIIINELSNYYFFSGGVYPETKNEALRGVYPEPKIEILRRVYPAQKAEILRGVYPAVGGTQDDQRGAQDGRKRRPG
jgi:hypothetical protein